MKESISKRLKELNFPPTKNVTIPFIFDERALVDRFSSVVDIMEGKYTEEDVLPAPSFEECWKALPKTIVYEQEGTDKYNFSKKLFNYTIGYFNIKSDVLYHENTDTNLKISIENENITEAAAKMWILLKEKNLI